MRTPTAVLTERMVHAMSHNHQDATDQRHQHLKTMRWEKIAPESPKEDASEPHSHQHQDSPPPMRTKPIHQGNRSQRGNANRQEAVSLCLPGQQPREDNRERQQHRRNNAVHNTQSRGPDAKPVGSKRKGTRRDIHRFRHRGSQSNIHRQEDSRLNMLMRFYLHLSIKSSGGPAIAMLKIPVAPYSLFPVFRQSQPQAVSPKHPPTAWDSRPCSRPCRRRRGRVRQRTLR